MWCWECWTMLRVECSNLASKFTSLYMSVCVLCVFWVIVQLHVCIVSYSLYFRLSQRTNDVSVLTSRWTSTKQTNKLMKFLFLLSWFPSSGWMMQYDLYTTRTKLNQTKVFFLVVFNSANLIHYEAYAYS